MLYSLMVKKKKKKELKKPSNFIFNRWIHHVHISGIKPPCNIFLLSFNMSFCQLSITPLSTFYHFQQDFQKMPIAAWSSASRSLQLNVQYLSKKLNVSSGEFISMHRIVCIKFHCPFLNVVFLVFALYITRSFPEVGQE